MSLVSFEFAVFFTAVLLGYYVLPHRVRWAWLLAAGYCFYATWNLAYVPLLMFTTAYFYLIGGRIAAAQNPSPRRNWLIAGVLLSLAILFTFQYANFFSTSLGGAALVNLPVPIGISFYTFLGIAYLVDIFRQQIQPEKRPERFALFVAFFPTLTSGPIERAGRILPQFETPAIFDEPRVIGAFRLILWGVFKKLVIADRLAIYVNEVYNNLPNYSGLTLLTATIFYAFQIYADFSAYSDVAVGVARLLGIEIIENFKQPYLAMSLRDFWQRWHISLSTWIRDYMFMPLSRVLLRRSKGKYPRWIQGASNFVVMVLVGLWHGPSWTFVIWGALHGLYMSVESVLGVRVKIPKVTTTRQRFIVIGRTLLTFVLVMIAWVFFRVKTVSDAGYVFTHIFNFSASGDITLPFQAGVLGTTQEFVLSLGLIALIMAVDWLDQRRGWLTTLAQQRTMIRWAVYYGLGALIVLAFVYGTSTQEFIYFQF